LLFVKAYCVALTLTP